MALSTTSLGHLGGFGLGSTAAANLSDPGSLQGLRSAAGRDPKAAVDEAARQFEALFMQELMKSMRQTTMSSGLMDNEGTQMGTQMLDSQFALKMTGLPGGLSQAIARQLMRTMARAEEAGAGAVDGAPVQGLDTLRARLPVPQAQPTAAPGVPCVLDKAEVDPARAEATARRSPHALQFVQQHTAAARAVAASSGIPAEFMIGQAAHETAWGRREILMPDGRTSHNLFGIKAGAGWKGAVAEIVTTEYVDGEPRKMVQRFRAYDSYEASFRDYARLLQDSPRYDGVMRDLATDGATVREFAQGLQQAGYATDPRYAEKLSRVINTTLHLQRSIG